MAHKVHPKAYRLKNLSDWHSRWFNEKDLPKYLEEDLKTRDYIEKKLGKIGIDKVEFERFPGKLIIIVSTARPGLIIGRGGSGIEDLKKDLVKNVFKGNDKLDVKINIKEIKDPWSSSALSAQWIAQQLERRIHPRRVLKQAMEKIMLSKGNKGGRIDVAGRLGGSEIARREWLKKGRMPLQTLRADIDYAQARAYCAYGVIGIKVWIYKGEKFD